MCCTDNRDQKSKQHTDQYRKYGNDQCNLQAIYDVFPTIILYKIQNKLYMSF